MADSASLKRAKQRRKTIRLKGYDYSQAGAYFVTICARNRSCLFGEIVDGEMRSNACGRIVGDSWQWLPHRFAYVEVDAWIVMPNHLHGILVIHDDAYQPLARLIGAFKTVSARRINIHRDMQGASVWQRGYYEHVVRDEKSLNRIRQYIADNPAHWAIDRENPSATAVEPKNVWLGRPNPSSNTPPRGAHSL
jgi:REP-associated tyrosine transposase